jgi:hypothetical protein
MPRTDVCEPNLSGCTPPSSSPMTERADTSMDCVRKAVHVATIFSGAAGPRFKGLTSRYEKNQKSMVRFAVDRHLDRGTDLVSPTRYFRPDGDDRSGLCLVRDGGNHGVSVVAEPQAGIQESGNRQDQACTGGTRPQRPVCLRLGQEIQTLLRGAFVRRSQAQDTP